MNNNRIGCLTGSGLIAGGLTFLIIVVISLLQGGVLFSPGALNAQAGLPLNGVTSHAGTDGQCKFCHAPFWSSTTMTDRCEGCHTNITAQRNDTSTLHGVILQNASDLNCLSCHPDHRGENALLTDMSKVNFPHDTFGYSLSAHQHTADGAPFSCSDCHTTRYTQFDKTVCQTCHNDIDALFTTAHVLSFGTECRVCHDGIDTYGSNFTHNIYPFPLIGKHAEADCFSCHLNARSIPDLQSARQDCYSCHAEDDAHDSSYGTDCEVCHTPEGWEPATFDHNLASFKLEGKHATVECDSCHINNVFLGTPSDCYSCHAEDDEHAGSFGTACGSCHSTSSWKDATFNHNTFPLTDGHDGLTCVRCHTVQGVFKGLSTECASCHDDPFFHLGMFSSNCAECHSTSNWSATYSGSHPNECDGQCIDHENASCRDCHTSNLSSATCTKCHDSNNPGDDD